MTSDIVLLRKREKLLLARIAVTQDPFLRDNLAADLEAVVGRIQALSESAA
jgi:hypothetical protein